MREQFIPYKLAHSLRLLGFKEKCFGYYKTKLGNNYEELIIQESDARLYEMICIPEHFYTLVPTFSQAFKWFREKHELVVDWNYSQHDNFGSYIGVCIKNIHFEETFVGVYKTYEEAELACLQKLIQLVDKK